MNIQLKTNIAQVLARFDNLSEKIATPAIVRAINTATRDGKAAATKSAVAVSGVRAGAVRKRVTGGRKAALASRKKMSSVVYLNFQQGVKASEALNKSVIKKYSTRSSFVATMPSGHMGIFERTGRPKRAAKTGAYAGQKIKRGPRKGQALLREPIDELRIPLHPHATNAAQRAWESKTQAVFEREIERQLKRLIDKNA